MILMRGGQFKGRCDQDVQAGIATQLKTRPIWASPLRFVVQIEVTIYGAGHQPKVHGEQQFAKISLGATLTILGAAWTTAVRTCRTFAARARFPP